MNAFIEVFNVINFSYTTSLLLVYNTWKLIQFSLRTPWTFHRLLPLTIPAQSREPGGPVLFAGSSVVRLLVTAAVFELCSGVWVLPVHYDKTFKRVQICSVNGPSLMTMLKVYSGFQSYAKSLRLWKFNKNNNDSLQL